MKGSGCPQFSYRLVTAPHDLIKFDNLFHFGTYILSGHDDVGKVHGGSGRVPESNKTSSIGLQ